MNSSYAMLQDQLLHQSAARLEECVQEYRFSLVCKLGTAAAVLLLVVGAIFELLKPLPRQGQELWQVWLYCGVWGGAIFVSLCLFYRSFGRITVDEEAITQHLPLRRPVRLAWNELGRVFDRGGMLHLRGCQQGQITVENWLRNFDQLFETVCERVSTQAVLWRESADTHFSRQPLLPMAFSLGRFESLLFALGGCTILAISVYAEMKPQGTIGLLFRALGIALIVAPVFFWRTLVVDANTLTIKSLLKSRCIAWLDVEKIAIQWDRYHVKGITFYSPLVALCHGMDEPLKVSTPVKGLLRFYHVARLMIAESRCRQESRSQAM